MNKNFSVEDQFKEYARRVKLDRGKVSFTQWIETKRAFFAAWGQLLLVLRDEVSEFNEDDGVEILEQMKNEVMAFWEKEAMTMKSGH